MNIPLLENDHALRFALSQVLEDDGHTVQAAADIIQTTRLIGSDRVDLLFLDLMIGNDRASNSLFCEKL